MCHQPKDCCTCDRHTQNEAESEHRETSKTSKEQLVCKDSEWFESEFLKGIRTSEESVETQSLEELTLPLGPMSGPSEKVSTSTMGPKSKVDNHPKLEGVVRCRQ